MSTGSGRTWRDEPAWLGMRDFMVECVEVPLDDLRAALDGPPKP